MYLVRAPPRLVPWTLTNHSLTSSSFRQTETSELRPSLKKSVDCFVKSYTTYLLSLNDPADQRCAYLCGNSLGPLNRLSRALLDQELNVWGTRYVSSILESSRAIPYLACRAVGGHFEHPYGREWKDITNTVTPFLAELVGKYHRSYPSCGTENFFCEQVPQKTRSPVWALSPRTSI